MSETREEIQSEIIKCYFQESQLDEAIYKQISKILEIQYQIEASPEVGGFVFIKDDMSLELRVNKPAIQKELETCLSNFEKGDYSNIEPLYGFMQEAESIQASYLDENDAELLVYKGVVQILEKLSLNSQVKLSEEKRNNLSALFRKVINSFYAFKLDDIEEGDGRFMGLFHVHKKGTIPSGGDLVINKRHNIPNLVISSTHNYKQEGIEIYLVHSGSYERLYEGTLDFQPTK